MGLFALNRTPVLVLPVENDLVGDDTLEVLVEEALDEAATHAVVPRHANVFGYPVVLFAGGVDAVVRDASDPHGSHLLERLLTRWAHGVRPLDVVDDAVARTYELPREFARLGLRE
jgi:CTP:molybdopterin cytidylyltransferase MocA